jgi:hypothetical protein
MTHQAAARILIVAEDADLLSLYGAILESDNHYIHKSTYTSLVVAPKDWSDLSLIVLVDEYRISPVAPDYFRKTVEDLLQKKRSNRACAM